MCTGTVTVTGLAFKKAKKKSYPAEYQLQVIKTLISYLLKYKIVSKTIQIYGCTFSMHLYFFMAEGEEISG